MLAPLALSIAARIVFLLIGIGLFALGGWAVASLATGTSAWSIPFIIACAVSLSLLKGAARYLEQFAGHFRCLPLPGDAAQPISTTSLNLRLLPERIAWIRATL